MTTTTVPVVQEIMSANDSLAAQNRQVLDAAGVLGVNIMASPGAGKTSVILRTIEALKDTMQLGVVEGDTAAVTIDADKVITAGMPAVQINTGGQCHLDAVMLGKALPALPLDELDLLIVENVGNLICPAAFNLGTHFNVVIASVPEGDDKPYKYPNIDFNQDYFRQGIEVLNPGVTFFPMSCTAGEGVREWTEWLQERVGQRSASQSVS